VPFPNAAVMAAHEVAAHRATVSYHVLMLMVHGVTLAAPKVIAHGPGDEVVLVLHEVAREHEWGKRQKMQSCCRPKASKRVHEELELLWCVSHAELHIGGESIS
jgi:hypothetical protein